MAGSAPRHADPPLRGGEVKVGVVLAGKEARKLVMVGCGLEILMG